MTAKIAATTAEEVLRPSDSVVLPTDRPAWQPMIPMRMAKTGAFDRPTKAWEMSVS
jgi:hypothetical protein